LHVRLHEVLGIRLQHVVDLVEEIVDVGLDLVTGLGDCFRSVVDGFLLVLTGLRFLYAFGYGSLLCLANLVSLCDLSARQRY